MMRCLPGTRPAPASPTNDAAVASIQSPTIAESQTMRHRSSRGSNDFDGEVIVSEQPDTVKRRRLDLSDLTVKLAAPAKLISAKPVVGL